MYLVLKLIEGIGIDTGDSEPVYVPLSVTKGMIGACPVFKYKKDAKKHAKEDAFIMKVSYWKKRGGNDSEV